MTETGLSSALSRTFETLEQTLRTHTPELEWREYGLIQRVEQGVVGATGLPGVRSEELVTVGGDSLGMVFNLEPDGVDIILLDEARALEAGDEVSRLGRVADVPVGRELLGRIVDPIGRPLDGRGAVRTSERRSLERDAPGIMDREPVTVPLQTGTMAVDALIPIGRGQRELILGDRQTGKTAIAVDAILNQEDTGVLCIYCAISQRSSSVASVVSELEERGALERTIVVMAGGEDPPGLNYIAPYAATAMAEYFMDRGEDVLVVYDDLTRHARAYRELSLLMRRPPAREAYPGDIFYIHSRMLERSTHLAEEQGGGSITALPIIETQAQNVSAYIPTNLISITDGQIMLSPTLFQQGVLPPVEIGRSVSRVGGKAQLPAYRSVTGDLRLAYSQFQELESFSRFGVRLEEETRRALERGRRVREVLKQPQYRPIPAAQQVCVLLAVTEGLLDEVELEGIAQAAAEIRRVVAEEIPEVCSAIEDGEPMDDGKRGRILEVIQGAVERLRDEQETGQETG